MKKIATIALLASMASASALPQMYDENTTSPQELREVRAIVNEVIIPPNYSLSCESGKKIEIDYNTYVSHVRSFSDYQFLVSSDTYRFQAQQRMLTPSNTHYHLNSETITIDNKRYFCVKEDYSYNPIFSQKKVFENRKESQNVSFFERIVNFFKGV